LSIKPKKLPVSIAIGVLFIFDIHGLPKYHGKHRNFVWLHGLVARNRGFTLYAVIKINVEGCEVAIAASINF
jgi:hypothetical protein